MFSHCCYIPLPQPIGPDMAARDLTDHEQPRTPGTEDAYAGSTFNWTGCGTIQNITGTA